MIFCAGAGGGKKGRGRGKGGGGGSGKGVRGVDFGLGIGYSAESTNPPSQSVPSRSPAVNALRTGMMSQFKSNFVAATSDAQKQGSNTYAINKPVLRGFVSGGSIGGDIKTSSSFSPAPNSGGNATTGNSRDNNSQKNLEGSAL